MKKFFVLFLIMFVSLFGSDYENYVKDIEARFDKAYKAYVDGDFSKAKDGFTMAYFEVFENLEGPIRINVSAKKSYLMEAQFVDLRKMVKKRAPKEEIKESMDSLVKEMHEVLPELQTHVIVAEGVHGDEEEKTEQSSEQELVFDENWAHALNYIQDNFKKSLDAYTPENSKKSRDFIRDAQFEGYRNTQLEIMIRKEISTKKEGEIQALFPALIEFIHTKPTKEALKQELDSALASIADIAKGLKPFDTKKVLKKKKAKDYTATTKEIEKRFEKAFSLADKGEKKKAISLIQDTYFDIFEASGMENAIGAKNASLKTSLEGYFSKLIGAVKKNLSKSEREEIFSSFKEELKKALEILKPSSSTPWSLFLYSLTIILREGLEALLIVTAIVAYLVKSGNEKKMGIVYSSLTVAIVLSFLTAWVMNVIFGATAGENREILEGATMLVASLMLFYVSYWLLSNAEAKKWKDYISTQVSESLSSGSVKALWFTVFLAVYREGAETVLFYQALISEANSSTGYAYLTGGFILGVILLFVIYFVLRYTAIKLPIRPFFIVTGVFIYVMCFMFVGQGVAELIEGKLIIPTLIDGVPTITSLGIYPYMQTLVPQGIVLLLGIIGLFFINREKTRV